MKIGIDISIQTCRDEGYLVADVDKRAFDKAPTTTDLDFHGQSRHTSDKKWGGK